MTLKEQFESFGAWKTEFIINGEKYGGRHSYKDDPRIKDFFTWCDRHETILELGSCEGGHTALLAPKAKTVIGYEGKPHLIERAQFAMESLGIGNASFREVNFDNGLPFIHGQQFDVVFCSGILYHLKSPWRLIKAITERFYLATHYSIEKDAFTEGYWGKYNEDGSSDDWAGLTPHAFWFTLKSLQDCLRDNGFCIEHMNNWKEFKPSPHPMVSLFCRRA